MNFGSQERDFVRAVDWAELQLLYSDIGFVSLEYLRTEFDTEGLERAENDQDEGEPGEAFIAQVAREIERRISDAGQGYPFDFNNGMLSPRTDIEKWNPYVFCLLVSDRDYYSRGDRSARIFEHVAAGALASYLQGDSLRFGAPRNSDNLPSDILSALHKLSQRTGDPLGPYPVNSSDKDLGLDVVGWKNFVDGRTSKIQVYMQCATGEDWKSKRVELDLGGKWDIIMTWTLAPVRGLAIPYVVAPEREWNREAPGLLLFDRLRICSLLPTDVQATNGIDWSRWCEGRVAKVREEQGRAT